MVKQITEVKPVVPIPETLLKKRRRNLKNEKERVEKAEKVRAKRKDMRKQIAKRAEKYSKEYRKREADLQNQRLQAMELGNFFVEPEPKLAFVIRIRGQKDLTPARKKALTLLRLRQINNGVFVRLTKATINMLRLVEPCVAWGYPNLQNVRELIYKRGFAKVNGQRVPLTSNSIIEKQLAGKGIVCVEDLIHEVFTVGKNFKNANNFLWPFKLHSARGGLSTIKKHFILGGDCGNREEYINDLIQKML